MNSLNRDAKDSTTAGYSVCPTSASESMPITSERMACGGARFQYLDNCAPLVPIELPGVVAPATSANLTELESAAGLVYMQQATPVSLQHHNHQTQDYFQSASFNSLTRAAPQTYASLISAPMHLREESIGGGGGGGGISFATSISGGSHHGSYMDAFSRNGTSAPLQHIIGSLTTKLPELHSGAASVPSHDLLSYPASSLQRSSAGDCSSSHIGLISPAYSPSSVTTQGSGSSKQTRSAGQPGEEKVGGSGVCKSRSKKESHNRIERRRRDYINSQIARLSSLLPPELYRDVDGRRNKGTVLRLSVTYIMELRNALSQAAHIRQETSIARQLIPLLLNHMQALENVVKEVASASNAPDLPSSLLELTSDTGSYEITLEAWRLAMETNISHSVAAAANENSPPDPVCGSQSSEPPHRTPCSHGSSNDLHSLPLLENMQVSFGGPVQQQQQPRVPSSSSSLQLQLSSPALHQTATGRVDPVFLTGLKQEDEDQQQQRQQQQQQQQQQRQQQQQDFAAMVAAATAATRTNGKRETGQLGTEDDFNDFQEKSNDMVDGFYDDPNVQTFDEMMQMTTDCVVEPVQTTVQASELSEVGVGALVKGRSTLLREPQDDLAPITHTPEFTKSGDMVESSPFDSQSNGQPLDTAHTLGH
ncbi:unnamed protein product [Schistocephalus solidus]|uniref:Transcription factor EB n=1 Tax=Schistocephalus solidus TaxID=70667 RepID=A0A183SE23_SCHSO|nr:unnamed protein product [Schistocephalus solidus]